MSHATPLHHRGSLADDREIMHAAALPGTVDDAVYGHVQERVVSRVQGPREEALEEEVWGSLGDERDARRLVPQRPAATRRGTSRRAWWTPYGLRLDWRVPKRRRGHRDLPWQRLARYERCWGPLLDQQLLQSTWGHRRRDRQAAMPLTVGEGRSLEACNRLVLGRQKRAAACKPARLARPPPIVVMAGWWRKLAGPPGEIKQASVGRKRPVQPQEKRGRLTALGLWAAGPWEMLTWPRAPGEAASSWGALREALSRTGGTEETPQWIVRAGAPGLEKALSSPRWDVPQQRGLCHTIKHRAEHLPYRAWVRQAPEGSSGPRRPAQQDDQQAILAAAGQMYATDVEAELRARPGFARPRARARAQGGADVSARCCTDLQLSVPRLSQR